MPVTVERYNFIFPDQCISHCDKAYIMPGYAFYKLSLWAGSWEDNSCAIIKTLRLVKNFIFHNMRTRETKGSV